MTTSTGRSAFVIGRRSDLAQELTERLEQDGWSVSGWARGEDCDVEKWELCIVAVGCIAPIGLWHKQDAQAWMDCVISNALLPVEILRVIWPAHNPGASICFMAGANPNKPMAGYSAYSVGKMALLKACEHLDLETPDAKFFALGPGTVLTKIHNATIKAKWPNPILEKNLKAGEDRQAKIDRIYGCLKWCMAQRKEDIGGRNICASDEWDKPWFLEMLRHKQSMLKLRRVEK